MSTMLNVRIEFGELKLSDLFFTPEPPSPRPPLNVTPNVARGVEYLDREVPGWHDRINLRTLNMSNGERCIVGQLFGNYEQWLWGIGSPMTAGALGFAMAGYPCEVYDYYDSMDIYSELDREWRKVITERRAKDLEVSQQQSHLLALA